MDSSRFLFTAIWGGGVVILAVVIVVVRGALYVKHHDARSFRDFIEGLGFGLVAFFSSFAIATVVIVPEEVELRSFSVLFALGSFFGALLVMAGNAIDQLNRQKE
jgi:hypothetical protein